MADTVSTRVSNDSFDRAAAIAGLGFAILVITHNVMRGEPLAVTSSADEVLAYYQGISTILTISHVLFSLALPMLLIYATGLMRRYTLAGAAEPWARVGRTTAYLVALGFGAVMAADMAATHMAALPDADRTAVHTLFALRGGFFLVLNVVLAVTLGTFAWAAQLSGAEPRWLSAMGLIGAPLLFLGALAGIGMPGSPLALIGFGGFILWLVWVLTTSTRMLRSA